VVDAVTTEIVMRPIGVVRGGRTEPIDDHWAGVEAEIALDDRFGPDALLGLSEFSHLDVVYVFHGVDEDDIVVGARHPREREDWPLVGIFAQRGRVRPNRLGVGTCRLLGVHGRTLRVADLDAIDGSPVLDVKPHLLEMGPRSPVREPSWVVELMHDYW
jgi:tRNA-Thr(GGU) m(6)t(6)A37 methyltransferase TsaA